MSAVAPLDRPQLAVVDEWTDARKDFIRRNFCAGAPDEFVQPFLALCEKRNLSPEAKHIYLVPRYDAKAKRNIYTPQTSIDGYRLIAARTGQYAGSDDPLFAESGNRPSKATVTVYRAVAGTRCPFTASAYWSEYYPGANKSFMWDKMPHTMLAKVAESLALRKAFPEEMSGLYTTEEMAQANDSTTLREVDVDPETGEIVEGEFTAVADDPEPLHLDQADIDRFMGRIFDANNAEPDDRRKATNALYKEAQQSPELADLLIANLSDYNAARMVADELKKKGLLTAKGEQIINGRAEEVSQ